MESRSDIVTREDLLLFINACFAATAQREFYDLPAGAKAAHEDTLAFLHRYVCGNYRSLYARTLACGVNDYAKTRIVQTLLATGRETSPAFRTEENALIRAAVASLPPQRAYKLFAALRVANINNRRAIAVVRDYLANRPDAVFDAVKYRGKVRAAATHAHLKLPGELGAFLFDNHAKSRFQTPLFETFRQARYTKEAVYRLPYTVAEGLATKHGIARAEFLKNIAAKMTQTERERLLRSSAEAGVQIVTDLSRMPLTRLALYVLALPIAERETRRAELEAALRGAARRALRETPLPLPESGTIAAVLDNSYSASGSDEKRRRPLAVALGVHYLLAQAANERYAGFWSSGDATDPLLATARGATDLASPLIRALQTRPALVIVVSDGYENDPPGAVDALLRVFRQRLDPDRRTVIVHTNPMFAADEYEPRALSPLMPTLGVRDAETLAVPLAFARFVGANRFAALDAFLRERAQAFVEDLP